MSQAASDLGDLTLVTCKKGVLFLGVSEAGHEPAGLSTLQHILPKAHTYHQVSFSQQIESYLISSKVSSDTTVKLCVMGSEFKFLVFKKLIMTERGKLLTYGKLASKLNKPSAARAVGTALGHNLIACLIPCHRVIRANGGHGQFRWGAARKSLLIEREQNGLALIQWIKQIQQTP